MNGETLCPLVHPATIKELSDQLRGLLACVEEATACGDVESKDLVRALWLAGDLSARIDAAITQDGERTQRSEVA